MVEAETVDAAMTNFLCHAEAELVGDVDKYPGFQAVATARSKDSTFTLHVLPASDPAIRNRTAATPPILVDTERPIQKIRDDEK